MEMLLFPVPGICKTPISLRLNSRKKKFTGWQLWHEKVKSLFPTWNESMVSFVMAPEEKLLTYSTSVYSLVFPTALWSLCWHLNMWLFFSATCVRIDTEALLPRRGQGSSIKQAAGPDPCMRDFTALAQEILWCLVEIIKQSLSVQIWKLINKHQGLRLRGSMTARGRWAEVKISSS